MPHGVPFPGDAPAVHGDPDGGSLSTDRDPAVDAADPGGLPVGALPAQSRRADARDGDRRGTRLHVSRLRAGPEYADQPGNPPPAGAAARERSPPDRADERAALFASRHAG